MKRKCKHPLLMLTTLALMTPTIGYCQGHGMGGHGGGEEESVGSNLSQPLLFPEGIGLTGTSITDDVSTGLRTTVNPPGYALAGAFRYLWNDGSTAQLCDPAQPGCPPPATELQRVYLQQDAASSWQAEWKAGTQTDVSTIDWGDNLESHMWSTKQRLLRIEVGLTKTLAEPMRGWPMQFVSGQGQSEMWGIISSNANPSEPAPLQSTEAAVFTPCARLTIQKLYRDAGDPEQLPKPEDFTWSPTKAEWLGPTSTLLNRAIWERTGEDGPGLGIGAEVNIKGNLVYGYNWFLRDTVLPPNVKKVGWYRLTFSLDGSGGKECSTYTLQTSLRNAALAVSEEEGSEATTLVAPTAESEEESRPTFTAAVLPEQNLTYLDVYVAAGLGEVTLDQPPVCVIDGPYSLPCAGSLTDVVLRSDGTTDPDGDELEYVWETSCESSTLLNASDPTAILRMTLPGQGIAQQCEAKLTVREVGVRVPLSSSCSTSVTVQACPLDCFNTPFGQATIDACGVCGGTNACFDCSGTPFGERKFDRCGVCGGDGTSCLGCTKQSVAPTLLNLRTNARQQLRTIESAVRTLRRYRHRNTYRNRELLQARQLAASNATIQTTVPGTMNICQNTAFCVASDQSSAYAQYLQNEVRQQTLLRKLTREMRQLHRSTEARRLEQLNARIMQRTRSLMGGLPSKQSICY